MMQKDVGVPRQRRVGHVHTINEACSRYSVAEPKTRDGTPDHSGHFAIDSVR